MPRKCRCCTNCSIFTDDFNRSDNTDLGADWSEVSGSWSITSNTLRTSSTSALCIHDNGTGSAGMSLRVDVSGASGDFVRLIGGYQDTSNYWFAELKFGASGTGRFDLYQRSGGVNTLKVGDTASITPGGNYIKLCFMFGEGSNLDIVYAECSTDSGFASRISTHSLTTQDGCGVGTGSTASSSVLFDNFTVTSTDGNCPKCQMGCAECDGESEAPFAMDVTLPTIERLGSAGCPDCTIFSNQTYRVYRCGHESAPSICKWRADIGTCDGVTYKLLVSTGNDSGQGMWVSFYSYSGVTDAQQCSSAADAYVLESDTSSWATPIDEPFDCFGETTNFSLIWRNFTTSGRCRAALATAPTVVPVI